MSNSLRKKLKRYHYECALILRNKKEFGRNEPLPAFPLECVGMVCGAKTKAGIECKSVEIFKNGRCRLHGGLSTGPKTIEGKRRSALNTVKTYEELIRSKINY